MGIRDLFGRRKDPQEIFLGLRDRAFHLTRAQAGIADDFAAAWGVMMDWGVANGTATVVALADGSASIYLSSGGGYLGGHAQESIRSAAQLAVKLAATAQNQMKPAGTDFPLPGQGQVILYVHSDAGLLTASVPQQDLQSNRYPLSQLANAMQNVITQYRLHQQGHGAPEQKVT